MSLRTDLNTTSPNQLADLLRNVMFGEFVNAVITALAATPTEAAAVVTPGTGVCTMAAVPSMLYQANATAGGTTGVKTLIIGPITGTGAIVPKTGEVVWDGGLNLRFAIADAVTAAALTYSTAATASTSLLAGNQL